MSSPTPSLHTINETDSKRLGRAINYKQMLEHFLAIADVSRARHALRKLSRHNISGWALTGRFGIEFHGHRRGIPMACKSLKDIDFITASFDQIPATLANDYLFRHIHPFDPPEKTLVQFVDADSALRVDVFRTTEAVMQRAERIDLGSGPIAIASLEDLTARSARLAMSLREEKPLPPKHVADYLRLVEISDPQKLEIAWRDHRRPADPATFAETRALLCDLIPVRTNLQIPTAYSQDITAVCPRCKPAPPFHLTDAARIWRILGYV